MACCQAAVSSAAAQRSWSPWATREFFFGPFFPGVLPGRFFALPDGVDFAPGGPTYNAVLSALSEGLLSPDQRTLQFARTARLPGANVGEIVAAAMNVIGFTIIQGNELIDVTHGHMPYDNSATVYSGSLDDIALNAGVARFVSDPAAANYVDHYYTPGGDLRIPVLTLHATRDPLVPIFHEQLFAQAVQAAGRSDQLLQRTVDGFGHCGFPAAETTALSALVQWVHTGVKPQN